MSRKYLGEQIDIHGGGADLIFPHHENEIAQSESFTGKKPFVRYWLHNGLLQLGGEKMSKSLGNLITIKDFLSKNSADALRIFVLGSNYRSPLTFSTEVIDGAEKGAQRLAQALQSATGNKTVAFDVEAYRNRFVEAMDDDFNTPRALATLFDLARDLNRIEADGCDATVAKKLLRELADVLGLKIPRVVNLEVSDGITLKENVVFVLLPNAVSTNVNRLIEERIKSREANNWKRADEIRNKLAELGVKLEDNKTKTTVTYERVPSIDVINHLMDILGISLNNLL